MRLTKDIFVGRETELGRFREALPLERGMTFFSVVGPGGIGKTQLLHQMVRLCEDERIPNTGIIDFYDAATRTRTGLLNIVLQRLGQHRLPAGEEESTTLPLSWDRPAEDLRSAQLLARFQQRFDKVSSDRRVVLLFDTYEAVVDSPLETWFAAEFLPSLSDTATVVVAARPPGLLLTSDSLSLEVMELRPFSFPEVEALFRALDLDPLVTRPELRQVHHLTRGGPIELALVGDLLLRGVTRATFEDLLKADKVDFEHLLVHWVMRATDRAEQATLYMAHLVHLPMGVPMLADLSGWPAAACEAILDQVRDFSFVRVLGSEGYILHNEMRRLVNDQVWRITDPGQTVRRKLSLSLVEHLDRRLQALKDDPDIAAGEQMQSIRLERLYHLLFSRHPMAYPEFWEVVDEHWLAYRFDDMAVTLHTAEQCLIDRIEPDLTLRGLIKAFRALLRLEGPDWETSALTLALDAAESAANTKAPALIGALADYAAGTWFSLQGDSEKAVQYLDMAANTLERTGQELTTREPQPGEAVITSTHFVHLKYYEVQNTLGFVYRREGHFAKAATHYEKAMHAAVRARRETQLQPAWEAGIKRMEASSRNNLARTLLLLGRLGEARYWCFTGLQMLKSLKMEGPLGHSYNVLGLMYQHEERLPEAVHSFEEAIRLWTETRSFYDLGVAWRNLGWARLQQKMPKEAEACFHRAERLLTDSPLESELAGLYHGLGRLQLEQAVQQGQPLQQAQVTLQRAYQLARQYHQMYVLAQVCIDLWHIAHMKGDVEDQTRWEEEIRRLQASYRFDAVYGEFEYLLGVAAGDSHDLHQAAQHFVKAFCHWGQHNTQIAERRLSQLATYLVGLNSPQRSTLATEMARLVREEATDERILPAFLAVCSAYGGEWSPPEGDLHSLP